MISDRSAKQAALNSVGLRFRQPNWMATKAKGFTELETATYLGYTLLVFRTPRDWAYTIRSGGQVVGTGSAITNDLIKTTAFSHVTDEILNCLD